MPTDLRYPPIEVQTREQRIAASHRKANGQREFISLRDVVGSEGVDKDLGQVINSLARNDYLSSATAAVQKDIIQASKNALSVFAGAPADLVDMAYSMMQHAPKGVSDKPLPDIKEYTEPYTSEGMAKVFGGDPNHWSWLPAAFVTPGLNEVGTVKSMLGGLRGATNLGFKSKAYQRYQDFVGMGGLDNEPLDPYLWKETGWYKGADGEARFFISDADANFKVYDNVRDNKKVQKLLAEGGAPHGSIVMPLKDWMDHPNLYAAYPELKELPLRVHFKYDKDAGKFELGFANRDTSVLGELKSAPAAANMSALDSIHLYKETNKHPFEETLLHEIQHAVQELEGFARGGSSKVPTGDVALLDDLITIKGLFRQIDEGVDSPDALIESLTQRGMSEEAAIGMVNSYFVTNRLRLAQSYDIDDLTILDGLNQELELGINGTASKLRWMLEYHSPGMPPDEAAEAFIETLRGAANREGMLDAIAFQSYKNLHGEAEARFTGFARLTRDLKGPPDLTKMPDVQPFRDDQGVILSEQLDRTNGAFVARQD